MRIPGFGAEAALYGPGEPFQQAAGEPRGTIGEAVVPQKWGCVFSTPCLWGLHRRLVCCIVGGCFWRSC
jgi:hypothetical protein